MRTTEQPDEVERHREFPAVLSAGLGAIPSAVVVFDAQHRPVWANDSMLRLLDGADLDVAFEQALQDDSELVAALRATTDDVATRVDRVVLLAAGGDLAREAWVGPVPCPRDASGRPLADLDGCAMVVLPAEEERLHPLLAHTYDIIAVLASDGTIRYANPAAGRLMNYEGAVMAGTSAIDLVHPDDQSKVLEALADPDSVEELPLQLRLRFGDERWHHCLVHIANLLDDPAVRGIVVTVHDITDQVEAHQELVRSERWVRRIISQLTDVVVVFDSAGEISYISPSISRLNGTSHTVHVGTSAFGDIHPDDLGEVTEALTGLLADPDGEIRVTFRLRHDDGHYVWVEAVATNGLADPSVQGIVATVRDISALKQAEQMFRGLIDAAPDAMVLVDADGRLVLVNERAEQLFGWSAVELVGQPVEVLIPEAVHDAHVSHRAEFRKAPKRRRMGQGRELVARHRDGHDIPVEVSLSPHDTHLGPLVSAAVRDITDQRETRRALEAALAGEQEVVRRLSEADALKAEFVSTVAHELRNPLTTIAGFARLIEQSASGDVSPAQVTKLADRIAANADRLLEMIDQLLRFSRLEAGRAKLSRVTLALRPVIDQCAELLGEALAERTLDVSVADDLEVFADADGIANVVRNLVSNAAKFTPAGTTVTVTAATEAEGVTISVTDEGPGVPADQIDTVFEQFHQTDTGREMGGTGLGLSIARRYVELHGGRIWVDPDHAGGARFCFFLPHATAGA